MPYLQLHCTCSAQLLPLSLLMVAFETAVSPIVHSFTQIALLENVHCNDSLVWLKTSAMCYTINTEIPSRFLLDIQLLSWVLNTGYSFGSAGLTSAVLLQLIDGVDAGVGNSRLWIWVRLVAVFLLRSPPGIYSPQQAALPQLRRGRPTLSWLSDINMALGLSPDHKHQHGL